MKSDQAKEAEAATVPEDEPRLRAFRWLRILLLASLAVLLVAVVGELPASSPDVSSGGPRRLSTESGSAAGPDDHFIVAGQRVGFVRLGLSIQDVEARLGHGRALPTRDAVLYRFSQLGLTCAVQRGQVISVLVQNPTYRTPQGTAVGSDPDTVVRELGDGYEYESAESLGVTPSPASPGRPAEYKLHYWREGIHLTLRGEKVEAILVSAAVVTP